MGHQRPQTMDRQRPCRRCHRALRPQHGGRQGQRLRYREEPGRHLPGRVQPDRHHRQDRQASHPSSRHRHHEPARAARQSSGGLQVLRRRLPSPASYPRRRKLGSSRTRHGLFRNSRRLRSEAVTVRQSHRELPARPAPPGEHAQRTHHDATSLHADGRTSRPRPAHQRHGVHGQNGHRAKRQMGVQRSTGTPRRQRPPTREPRRTPPHRHGSRLYL